MHTLYDQVKTLWNSVRAGEAEQRAHFAIARDRVRNREPLGPPFRAKQHYFQIVVNEMFLSRDREWFVYYDPMTFVSSSYLYGAQEETLPFVVGPAMLRHFEQEVPEGMIYQSTPVSGLHPYQGGPLTLTIVLNKVQRENNADRLLQVVEGVSSAVVPSTAFTAYLAIAKTVVDGIEAILGLDQTEPVAGYRMTVNPDIGDLLEPSYFALIDEDETKLVSDHFWVLNNRLYCGEDEATSQPYRGRDFVLFSIAQGTMRSDEHALPFYPLWQTARDLATQAAPHYWEEAKANFNALKRELLKSPDLTEPDSTRLIRQYLEELKRIREEAVMESELADGRELPDMEAELRRVAEELNKLG
jgi:hypothetical protein